MIQAVTITTDRLTLEPLTEADVPALFEIAKDPRSIEDFQYAAETIDDVKKWIMPTFDDADNLVWSICKDGHVIGLFDVYLEAEYSETADNVCRVGYFIDVAHHRNGYATEALQAVIDWLFKDTPITRIEAGVTTHNTPSFRILEKVGFVREKVELQNWTFHGQTYDSAYYGLLK